MRRGRTGRARADEFPTHRGSAQGRQRAAGMAARRQILDDAHVDRAVADTTGATAEIQDLITRYVLGEIWTRPGLDHRRLPVRFTPAAGTRSVLEPGRRRGDERHVRFTPAAGTRSAPPNSRPR